MKVGISLTSNYPDVKDPRQGARWMIERAAAARRASLDSLFVGDQHVSPTVCNKDCQTDRDNRNGAECVVADGRKCHGTDSRMIDRLAN